MMKTEEAKICNFCEQYVDLNFCAYCGQKIAATNDQILRNKLRKIFADVPYLFFNSPMDDSLRYLLPFPFSSSEILKKNRNLGKLNQSKNEDNLKLITIGYLEAFNPVYGLEMDTVIEMISDLSINEPYIIDISELELNYCHTKKRFPMAEGQTELYKLYVKIKKIDIYTKKEYEEAYPFLKYCSAWFETFSYRDPSPYLLKYFESRDQFTEKLDIGKFVPFIENKVYIISSVYSEFIGKIIDERVLNRLREGWRTVQNHSI